ncbi:hypothetical protein AHAS_Ahas01G0171000 [Arachis hypogaea]
MLVSWSLKIYLGLVVFFGIIWTTGLKVLQVLSLWVPLCDVSCLVFFVAFVWLGIVGLENSFVREIVLRHSKQFVIS